MNETKNQKFNALVHQIKALNNFISKNESLGNGFQIGHSSVISDKEITDEWLASVVEYELLPLLDEYWSDVTTKILTRDN